MTGAVTMAVTMAFTMSVTKALTMGCDDVYHNGFYDGFDCYVTPLNL